MHFVLSAVWQFVRFKTKREEERKRRQEKERERETGGMERDTKEERAVFSENIQIHPGSFPHNFLVHSEMYLECTRV